MTFAAVLDKVVEILQRQGWVSYQTCKRRFQLEDASLDALKRELIDVRRLALDEDGHRLVWQGDLQPPAIVEASPTMGSSPALQALPASWTPALHWHRPLVGREDELRLLVERWTRVHHGHGQVVLIRGEAGIGKSHLVQQVKGHIATTAHRWWACRCTPATEHSPLYPVIDLLRRLARWQFDDSPDTQLDKLETLLAPYNLADASAVPLLAALLAVPAQDRYPPLALSPEQQKHRTFALLFTLVQMTAAQQPVAMIVEDVHWMDPSTLELLTHFVTQAPTIRLYLVLTGRLDFHPPWLRAVSLTSLTLNRLLPEQVAILAEQVAGGKRLPPGVQRQICVRTEGVPLFVEEVTKMVLESDVLRAGAEGYELTGPLRPLAIPTTLHDSLLARLQRLGSAQIVAQVGAAWGRGFTDTQLHLSVPLERRQLTHALAQLVRAEIVQEVNQPHLVTYIFRHALIQEVAYASMAPGMRQQTHQRIARVLTERFPEMVEHQPEVLAQHYTAADLTEQAVATWHQAAQRAARRSAYQEAQVHLTKGLELLRTLPETPAHTQQAVQLLLTLGDALTACKGYAAPEVGQVYAQAHTLCQRLGEPPFSVLSRLLGFYQNRGDLQTAYALGQRLLTIATRHHDPVSLVSAYHALGAVALYRGAFATARTHLDKGIALCDTQRLPFQTTNSALACLAYGAWSLWYLGYPDQALQRMHAALTLAQKLAQPYMLAYTLCFAASLHQYRREAPQVQEHAEAAIALATEGGFAFWVAYGTFLRGWALLMQGESTTGMEQMQQGFAAWCRTGAEIGLPSVQTLLAEGYGRLGQAARGLTYTTQALAAMQNRQERWGKAEVYRVHGTLLLQAAMQQSAPHAPATAALQEVRQQWCHALAITRQQSARSLMLRVAMDLSRLCRQQDDRAAAYEVLAQVYSWFTEGFDTADLQEARALLATLA